MDKHSFAHVVYTQRVRRGAIRIVVILFPEACFLFSSNDANIKLFLSVLCEVPCITNSFVCIIFEETFSFLWQDELFGGCKKPFCKIIIS